MPPTDEGHKAVNVRRMARLLAETVPELDEETCRQTLIGAGYDADAIDHALDKARTLARNIRADEIDRRSDSQWDPPKMHDPKPPAPRPTRNTQRLQPKNRADWLKMRSQDITASNIAALIGEHPYVTPYQLWAEKTGRLPVEDIDNEILRRGRLLEDLAFTLTAEQMPTAELAHNDSNSYYRDPAARIGATPDVIGSSEAGRLTVQLKSIEPSIYNRSFINGEPPTWIALQALTEAKVVGADWCAVGALRVGFKVEFDLIPIPIHAGAWQALQDAVGEFWKAVEADRPLEPNFARDSRIVAALNPNSEPGTVLDCSNNPAFIEAVRERIRLREIVAAAETEIDQIDTMIRHKAEANELILAGPYRVTLKTSNVKGYSVQPRTQRPIRVKALPAPESVP